MNLDQTPTSEPTFFYTSRRNKNRELNNYDLKKTNDLLKTY